MTGPVLVKSSIYSGPGIILFPRPIRDGKVDVFLVREGVTITVEESEVEKIEVKHD